MDERYRLKTASGDIDDPDEQAIADALEGIDADGAFVVLERGTTFVQFDGNQLERGEDGRLWRADLRDLARDSLGAFLAGRPLPEALPWRDVTDEVLGPQRARERMRSFVWSAVVLAIGAALAAAAWYWWLEPLFDGAR